MRPNTLSLLCLTIFSISGLTIPTHAEEAKLSLGVGGGVAPQFEGSKAYKAIPFATLRYEDENISVATNGPGLEIDFVPSRKLDLGLIVKAEFGRKGGIDDPLVRLLPRVGTGVEVGGFIATGLPLKVLGAEDPTILTVKLSAVQDIASGHKGALITSSFGAVRPIGKRMTLIGSASLTYASRNYMNAYFDVTPAASALTGLAPYRAAAGLKDVGLTAIANVKLGDPDTGNWSLTTIVSGKRLLGDAAASPIVRLRGTPTQAFFGLALNYRIF
jgi:MipA family protein